MEKTKPFTQDSDITDIILHRKNDVGLFILRLSIGGLMLFHGMSKIIYGTEQVENILLRTGMPVFFTFGVFLGEVLAPLMLILGYKVRLAGFLIAVDMLVATLLVHASDFTQMNELGGWMLELNALYFLGALSIIFLGSGRIAITKGNGALD